MSDNVVLSIDGMGGDAAPDIVVQGVDIAARRRPDLRFLIHGEKTRLEALLAAHPVARAASEVRPAEGVISMEMKPSQAMRQRGTSLGNAVASVENKEAHAIVSAGNTGAMMAIAMLRLRLLEGVHRPALTARWPTAKGAYCVVLDVGANVQADAEQLVEFAIMGEAFQRAICGVERPSIGLLNVGAEDQKGHEEIKAAAKLIRESGVEINFQGFVEGDDIAKGAADVIVTDGFTGNVALKTAEGTARMISALMRQAFTDGLVARIGALASLPALAKLRNRMDPGNFNGAVFLGVNGLVVKSHGSADGKGFAAALDVAARMAASHYREEIAANLARLAAAKSAEAQQASPAAAAGNSP